MQSFGMPAKMPCRRLPHDFVAVRIVGHEFGFERFLDKRMAVVLVIEVPADLGAGDKQVAATLNELLDLLLLRPSNV